MSAIHWVLIHRACYYVARAKIYQDARADKLANELLLETFRVLRSSQELVLRLEGKIADILVRLIPDPVERASVISSLILERSSAANE